MRVTEVDRSGVVRIQRGGLRSQRRIVRSPPGTTRRHRGCDRGGEVDADRSDAVGAVAREREALRGFVELGDRSHAAARPPRRLVPGRAASRRNRPPAPSQSIAPAIRWRPSTGWCGHCAARQLEARAVQAAPVAPRGGDVGRTAHLRALARADRSTQRRQTPTSRCPACRRRRSPGRTSGMTMGGTAAARSPLPRIP